MKRLLLSALLISLGMNIYLFVALQQVQPQERTASQVSPVRQPLNHKPSPLTSSAPTGNSAENAGIPTLAALQTLLEKGHFRELESRLQQALRVSPDNIDLLLLEGQLMVRTRPLSEAVIHLYSLRDLPLSQSQREALRQRINELVSTAVNQLKAAEDWDLLAQLLEPLFQIMPAHRPYILQLAEAYARQNKPTLMEDVLASLTPNDPQANRIRGLLPSANIEVPGISEDTASIEPDISNQQGITIQLEADGSHFIARVSFADQPARLMLDTGATTTAITRELYDRLRVRQRLVFVGNFEVNTAAGRVSAAMVQVPVVTFGPLRFTDLSVLVLPDGVMQNADGLLGMNMMQNMDFRLNQQTGELTLYRHTP
ncbi:TIGR02281 family clan AA aspartic protease [Alteromonas sp. H39]|uniref:TIGR02281 family clan AA aspartic protease n=1 Tax=Alteromonas sp. H39 TaxID=3389876 RepID=UPI0039E023FC